MLRPAWTQRSVEIHGVNHAAARIIAEGDLDHVALPHADHWPWDLPVKCPVTIGCAAGGVELAHNLLSREGYVNYGWLSVPELEERGWVPHYVDNRGLNLCLVSAVSPELSG